VLIPAFNEARVIEASVGRVLASREAAIEVIVIDDGSTDATGAIVAAAFAGEPRVKLLTLANGGKARALNQGLRLATGAVVVALDADTQFEPETIARLARWFGDPRIGAVAGNAKVGNRVNLVTRWQAIEYVTAQNLERRALVGLGAIMVVPGAVGAWRRAALDGVGGFPEDTLAEDQDLTIAVQRAGWRVAADPEAVAWTEAPQGFRALAKQRFRWSFGTLQCLWKHGRTVREGRPRGLAWIGIPQAWLFQILFSLVSPMIDLALVFSIVMTWGRVEQHGWAQTHTDLGWMAFFWLLFVTVDLVCGWIAFRMDRTERSFPAFLLIAQRFVYRQLMYWVVIKAVSAALRGHWVGWGKLERTGRSTAPAAA
jgi:cellulose synthase/poly-beta-1,6-N-acetylglucosamine synthase-like glycosyltransferase